MSKKIRTFRGKESHYDGTSSTELSERTVYYKMTEGVRHFFNLSCDRVYYGKSVLYSEGVFTFEGIDKDDPAYTFVWAPDSDHVTIRTGSHREEIAEYGIREKVRMKLLYNWPGALSLWISSMDWAEAGVPWSRTLKNVVRLASEHGVPVMVHTTDLGQDHYIRPCARYGDIVVTVNNYLEYKDDTECLDLRYDKVDFGWRKLSDKKTQYVYLWADAFGIEYDPKDNRSMQLAYNQLSWYQFLDTEWDAHYDVCPECGHPTSLEAKRCSHCLLPLDTVAVTEYHEYSFVETESDDYSDESQA